MVDKLMVSRNYTMA